MCYKTECQSETRNSKFIGDLDTTFNLVDLKYIYVIEMK